jgi:hypothetical protein
MVTIKNKKRGGDGYSISSEGHKVNKDKKLRGAKRRKICYQRLG